MCPMKRVNIKDRWYEGAIRGLQPGAGLRLLDFERREFGEGRDLVVHFQALLL